MSSEFQIWISDDELNKTPFQVTNSTTIGYLKQKYYDKFPDEANKKLAIIYKGEQVDDYKTIGDLKIKKGKTLQIFNMDANFKAAKLPK